MRRTPYAFEDWAQEAFCAALEALAVHERKRIPFEAAFWTQMKCAMGRMGTISVIAVGCEEEVMWTKFAKVEADIEDRIDAFDDGMFREGAIERALGFMTAQQRAAWSLYVSGKYPTTDRVAGKLRVRRQTVETNMKRSVSRARKRMGPAECRT
jgi:hypothetical protein